MPARKDPHELRDRRLPHARLTTPELDYVTAQAAAAGLTTAEFARRRVLGRKVAPPRSMADASLVYELNRVGVLLNQIARAIHRDRPEQMDLAAALADVRAVLARVPD